MPRKQKVIIREPGQSGSGRPEQRKVYVSWFADDLELASEWVGYLSQIMEPIKLDDADTRVTTVVPNLKEGSNSSMAGNVNDADLRDARKDVTDVLVVATSAYLNQQIKQAGTQSDLGEPASELLWFLSLQPPQPPRLPICWLAMLEGLKLSRYRVGEINLGDLKNWHKLKEERFTLLDENRARFIDDIGHATDDILGHSLSKCPTCNPST